MVWNGTEIRGCRWTVWNGIEIHITIPTPQESVLFAKFLVKESVGAPGRYRGIRYPAGAGTVWNGKENSTRLESACDGGRGIEFWGILDRITEHFADTGFGTGFGCSR